MPTTNVQPQFVHYIPVVTTLLSAVFFVVLLRRHQHKGRGAHLLWWAAGVACYGLGTGLEASITLLGNSVALTKAWYVAGAILGGYPLAQGTVYLLLRRKTANLLTICTVPIIIIVSILVIVSPVNMEALEPHRPAGAVIGWRWVRMMTPLVNGYAAVFLIGGAVLSAIRFARKRATLSRAIGNTFIAVGALLPGVGGGMAKAGIVEGLYVGEFVGIIMIWIGYGFCVRRKSDVPVMTESGATAPAGAPSVA
jgi:hypothetical protein